MQYGKYAVWKVWSGESVQCGKCSVWKVCSVESVQCGKCAVWKGQNTSPHRLVYMLKDPASFFVHSSLFLCVCFNFFETEMETIRLIVKWHLHRSVGIGLRFSEIAPNSVWMVKMLRKCSEFLDSGALSHHWALFGLLGTCLGPTLSSKCFEHLLCSNGRL